MKGFKHSSLIIRRMATTFLFIMQKYFITKEHDIELPLKRYLSFNEKMSISSKICQTESLPYSDSIAIYNYYQFMMYSVYDEAKFVSCKFKLLRDGLENIFYSDQSIEYFIKNPRCCDVVFDCTDASSACMNAKIFLEQSIKVIDLTPSNVGSFYIPNISVLSNTITNINMVTCGGQVSIPLLHYLKNK